jgi:hypothetical protein
MKARQFFGQIAESLLKGIKTIFTAWIRKQKGKV